MQEQNFQMIRSDLTYSELKDWFRTNEIPIEYKFQSEIYIQSIDIMIAAHGKNVSKNAHATHCKRELQNIFNQIVARKK